MKYLLLVFAAAYFVIGCGERTPENPPRESLEDRSPTPPFSKGEAADSLNNIKKQYFPVISFIKGEITSVDSLPVGIKKYTGDNKSKFLYIKSDEFHHLAAEFTPHELEDSAFFINNYKENTFLDQATGSGTFMYTAKNGSLPVQRIDVITVKGDVYDKVKSIYIQKNYSSGDTVILKKMSWKPQQSFQIITEITTGSQQPKTEVTNVVWDSKEEG